MIGYKIHFSKPLLRSPRLDHQMNSGHSDVREKLKITNGVQRIQKTNKMQVKKTETDNRSQMAFY